MRPYTAWMAAGLAALAAAGCGGSDVDRTGRAAKDKPVTLTLANHESDPGDVQEWADAVERLSHGSLKLHVSNNWRTDEPDFDKGTIGDVRSGKVELAKVAARAYDEVGVTTFQPLMAPMLIDNASLEREVLGGSIGDRALAGTARLGVVGLALLPTELRRPVGITRQLRGPEDYRGARISTREGGVIEATLRALGAHRAALQADDRLDTVDGAELPPSGFNDRGALARSLRGITGNVVLWPKPLTIVMNRAAFDRLSPAQQSALRRAAGVARASAAEAQAKISDEARARLCNLGTNVVSASSAELAALRSAVQPVYQEITRSPQNADAVQKIQQMKSGTTPDTFSCAGVTARTTPKPQSHSPLVGTFRMQTTKQELRRSPLLTDAGEINDQNWGDQTLRFAAGRFRLTLHNHVNDLTTTGTYRTSNDKLVLDLNETGERFGFRWSLYHGTLKLRRDETIGPGPTPLVMKPWRAR